MNNKTKLILILLIVIVISIAIVLKLKKQTSSPSSTNQITSKNILVRDPNIANFVDEETGDYIVYNQETGEEIARVKTKEEIYYYETHKNEKLELEPEEISEDETIEENLELD